MSHREFRVGRFCVLTFAALLMGIPFAYGNAPPPERPPEPPRLPSRVPFEVKHDVTKAHSRLIVPRSLKGQFAELGNLQETNQIAATNRSWIAGLALAIGLVAGGLILLKTKKSKNAVVAALFLALTVGICGTMVADIAPPPEFRPKPAPGAGQLEIVIAPRGDTVILILGRNAIAARRR